MKIEMLFEMPGMKRFKVTYQKGGGTVVTHRVVYAVDAETARKQVGRYLGAVIDVEEVLGESVVDFIATATGLFKPRVAASGKVLLGEHVSQSN